MTSSPQRPEFSAALVLDASAQGVFVGLLGSGGAGSTGGAPRWLGLQERPGPPLENLFPALRSLLEATGLPLGAIDAQIYCQGPGSVLGLRLCAMALQTWAGLFPRMERFFGYNSLQLCAANLLRDRTDLDAALIVSDWKKGAWNALPIDHGRPGACTVIDDQTLHEWEAELFHLPQRKGWQAPPPEATTLRYEPQRLVEHCAECGLIVPTEGIVLDQAALSAFKKWNPQRHRS